MTNFSDRTIWTGDNLRGLNSAWVDLIYLDPLFNSNRDYKDTMGHYPNHRLIVSALSSIHRRKRVLNLGELAACRIRSACWWRPVSSMR